ncbi:MAG: periplasmic heavy metal sensor [Candidatus Glassbacteria bacterium]|nr:periplasmic heavy metal sensor [Candidatus Glassbacteria bacterium]
MKGFSGFLAAAAVAGLALCATGGWAAEEKQDEDVADVFQLFEMEIPELELPAMPLPGIEEYGMLAFAEGRDREDRRHRHAERIQLYRLWKIMEDIDLTDEQVDGFFPLMRQHSKTERELARERNDITRQLKEELAGENPSDSKLNQLLSDLKQNGLKVVESKNKAIDDAAEILNARQRARLALTLNQVERDIWESIARVHYQPRGGWPPLAFDKQKLEKHMQQLQQNLQRISKELKARGLPGLDLDIELEDLEAEPPEKDN